ncbi:uncharacterized protein LOC130999882 isoform X2 [Salvia miltiorrhiza]|uniref:uncharacterized protein LOC130999882 isoform X2 n=1 Tax=Salvia miltiorrhiza TaxID=226208 RepID=UPI0025ABD363|nr:uncharacterized protein LOC130999882 isoform X2 [Salvia miltiorrhiza]
MDADAPTKEHNKWKILELRALVLVSLFLQVVLVAVGSRRKYTKKKWVAAIIWLSYLSADSVGTLALGVLSHAKGDSKNLYTITALWAPFLLMHLGGPDTITAYAMADNELWLRHFLGLLVQASVAVYVFYRSFTRAHLNFLWMLIFVAGVVKYGERSWVLFSSSKDRYRGSLVSQPDPGPNYPKFMDEKVSKEKEGYRVSLGKAVDQIFSSSPIYPDEAGADETFLLNKAYSFFGTFKKLFADLILTFQDRKISVDFFKRLEWKDAFSIVEIELGLVFDLFYTKSSFLFSPAGVALRIFSCSSTVVALVTFHVIREKVYPQTEVIITYILLVGAVFLELYAVLTLFVSDRMKILLARDCMFLSLLQYLGIVPGRKRWANSMGQYNVLNHCLKYMPKRPEARWYPKKLHPVVETLDEWQVNLTQFLEKYLFGTNKPVPDCLKKRVFDELKERSKDGDKKKLKSYWEDKVLIDKEMECFNENDEVEFDQSLLVWHMATDICSHHTTVGTTELREKVEICKLLSEYMVHLLIMYPFMLPGGIGQIRSQDTCAEAVEFMKYEEVLSREKVFTMLSKVDVEFKPSEVKGDRSKSLFFDAQRLANALSKIEDDIRWENITQVWLDILTFAAVQCRWSDHAEKLSQGGLYQSQTGVELERETLDECKSNDHQHE